MQLEFHPLSEIFPLIEGKEFDDLVEDIREYITVPVISVGVSIWIERNLCDATNFETLHHTKSLPSYLGLLKEVNYIVFSDLWLYS